MESAATLRSLQYSSCTASHIGSAVEKPGMVPVHYSTCLNLNKSPSQGLTCSGKLLSSLTKQGRMVASCVKTSGTTVTTKSDVHEPNGALKSDSASHGSLEKNALKRSKFPNGVEDLILEVCDETKVAELKLKVGAFEMHLKRNTGIMNAPGPSVAPLSTPPPALSKAIVESSSRPQSPQKVSTEKVSPFTNVALEKSTKLADLEASGASGYVLVSSPTVGSFRMGRTLKGKKQPPICKKGDVIKEGQVIGFLDQFGTELPVKSDVAGEVLKFLFDDGEAVGYGDPLIAVLPSFHNTQ